MLMPSILYKRLPSSQGCDWGSLYFVSAIAIQPTAQEQIIKTLFTAEKCVFTQKSFVNSSKKRIFAAEKCVFTQKSNVKLNQYI